MAVAEWLARRHDVRNNIVYLQKNLPFKTSFFLFHFTKVFFCFKTGSGQFYSEIFNLEILTLGARAE